MPSIRILPQGGGQQSPVSAGASGADVTPESFRTLMLKKYPNMSKDQVKQLNDFVTQKKVQSLVENGSISVEDIPQGDRLEILSQLPGDFQKNEGLTSIAALPTGGERNTARQALDFVKQIQGTQDLSQGVSTGPASAFINNILTAFGKGTDQEALRDELGKIVRMVRQKQTGVAFSPQEQEEFERTFGTLRTQEEPLANKLSAAESDALRTLLNFDLSKDFLESEGVRLPGVTGTKNRNNSSDTKGGSKSLEVGRFTVEVQ